MKIIILKLHILIIWIKLYFNKDHHKKFYNKINFIKIIKNLTKINNRIYIKNLSDSNHSLLLDLNSVKRSLDSLLSVNKIEQLSKDNENSDNYKHLSNVLLNNISKIELII